MKLRTLLVFVVLLVGAFVASPLKAVASPVRELCRYAYDAPSEEARGISPLGMSSWVGVTLPGEAHDCDVDACAYDAAVLSLVSRSLIATNSVDDVVGGVCRVNSFRYDTLVLMADGSWKAISEVEFGDHVMAADPETGLKGARRVEDLHLNEDYLLADLVVSDSRGVETTIYTTQHHRIWSLSSGEWVTVGSLSVGESLQTIDESAARVVAVRKYVGRRWMFDLTVDGLHTFFVSGGAGSVLVHNQASDDLGTLPQRPAGEVARSGQMRIVINSADHNPPHAHVLNGNRSIQIGQNGKPLAGQPELTRAEREFVSSNKSRIRSQIGKLQRYWQRIGGPELPC